jgi:hypothetical protein
MNRLFGPRIPPYSYDLDKAELINVIAGQCGRQESTEILCSFLPLLMTSQTLHQTRVPLCKSNDSKATSPPMSWPLP